MDTEICVFYIGSEQVIESYLSDVMVYKLNSEEIVVPDGLVSYYKFEGNLNDALGVNNAINNNVLFDVDSDGLGIALFDGQTSSMEFLEDFIANTPSLSICFELMSNSLEDEQRFLGINNNEGGSFIYARFLSGSGDLQYRAYNFLDNTIITDSGINPLIRNFISITIEENGASRLYTNGVLIGSVNIGAFREVSSKGNHFGSSRVGSLVFNGQAKGLSIFNEALTIESVNIVKDILESGNHLVN